MEKLTHTCVTGLSALALGSVSGCVFGLLLGIARGRDLAVLSSNLEAL